MHKPRSYVYSDLGHQIVENLQKVSLDFSLVGWTENTGQIKYDHFDLFIEVPYNLKHDTRILTTLFLLTSKKQSAEEYVKNYELLIWQRDHLRKKGYRDKEKFVWTDAWKCPSIDRLALVHNIPIASQSELISVLQNFDAMPRNIE